MMPPPLKGLTVILILCCLVALFTYLSMTLVPGIKKSKAKAKEPIYYRAAVLEVVPFLDASFTINENIDENLKTYEIAVEIANSSDVDIIVFPESVLFTNLEEYAQNRKALIGSIAQNVPNPKLEDYNPCEQEYKFRKNSLLRKLSCLAKKGGLFLVANIVDYKSCNGFCGVTDEDATTNCASDDECPKDGLYFYNTNVVFNREGKLVARYHKKHLYYEPIPNDSKCPEDGYFETDFGTFSTFICFDMLFKEAEDIVEQTNVDNIAYPYYWYDHTPLIFFATVFQQAFAISNKINVLAADGHDPASGTLGSGIFSGSNGALIYTHIADGRSKLLISDVPRHPKEEPEVNLDDLYRKRFIIVNNTWYEEKVEEDATFNNECTLLDSNPVYDNLRDYNCFSNKLTDPQFVKLKYLENTVDVCSTGFCCSIYYKAKSMQEDYFAAASSMTVNVNGSLVYSLQTCFLTRCKSKDGKSCSSFLLNSKTEFQTIDLTGNFTTKYVYPVIVDSDLRLTKREEWNFNGKSQIAYQKKKENSSLLFIGLYGREFV